MWLTFISSGCRHCQCEPLIGPWWEIWSWKKKNLFPPFFLLVMVSTLFMNKVKHLYYCGKKMLEKSNSKLVIIIIRLGTCQWTFVLRNLSELGEFSDKIEKKTNEMRALKHTLACNSRTSWIKANATWHVWLISICSVMPSPKIQYYI